MGKKFNWLGLAAIGLAVVSSVIGNKLSDDKMKEAVDAAVDQKLKALTDGTKAD